MGDTYKLPSDRVVNMDLIEEVCALPEQPSFGS